MSYVTDWGWYKDLAKGRVRWIRMHMRHYLGNLIRNYVYERVSIRGLGYNQQPLAGYSTRPIAIPSDGITGPKPMRPPVGGVVSASGRSSYFKGGYREYRENLGLVSDRFVFTNMGNAWKDWRYIREESAVRPIQVGFTKKENQDAAEGAESRGRPRMFEVSDQEVSQFVPQIEEFLANSYVSGRDRVARDRFVQERS